MPKEVNLQIDVRMSDLTRSHVEAVDLQLYKHLVNVNDNDDTYNAVLIR